MANVNEIKDLIAQCSNEGGDINEIASYVQLMSSAAKTSLGLNQWNPDDKPQRADFNNDNRIIDSEITKLKNGKANYSTGTWTPSLSGSPAASLIRGSYTKIGNRVILDFVANVESFAGAQNTPIEISGLPFAASEIATGSMEPLRYTADITDVVPMIFTGENPKTIAFTKRVASHGGVGIFRISDLLASLAQCFRVNITYRTNA